MRSYCQVSRAEPRLSAAQHDRYERGASSLKVTIPDGVPVVDFTVAVKVTMTPKVAGFSDETIVVVVGATSVSLNTVPQPFVGPVHARFPPRWAVPYKLPGASRAKPA